MYLMIGLNILGCPINAIGGQILDCRTSMDVQAGHLDDDCWDIYERQ